MNVAAISLSTNLSIPATITTAHNTSRLHHRHHPPQESKAVAKSLALHRHTIKTLSKSGQLDEAFLLIRTHEPLSLPSCAAFLSACITHKSILKGQRLYLHLLLHHPTTILLHPSILSKFITLFSTFPDQLPEARRVLEHALRCSPHCSPDESVWSALAIGYINNGYPEKALILYSQMLAHRVEPNSLALSVVEKACTAIQDLRVGRIVHAQIIKSDNEPDQLLCNALLKLYNELGSFDEVLMVFESMPTRNLASWNELIGGLVTRDNLFKACEAFRRMIREGVGFDYVVLTTVLTACGRMASLYVGKEIHAQMVKLDEEPDILVLNSLLEMYANCGEIVYCRKVFDGMEVRTTTSWNTMLHSYAINGYMRDMKELFQQLVDCGIRPDGLTFMALLSGCSHAGLIEEGQVLFDRMRVEFQIEPGLGHYACLVDIYGRRGRIVEALEIVNLMPMEPSGSIFISLLNSCRLHSNVSLAEEIFKKLLEVEPDNPKNYIMMSNIYANAGMWEGVNRVREIGEKIGIQAEAECSWIQIKTRVHKFLASESYEFCNSDDYKKLWNELSEAPAKKEAVHGVNEEVKAEWVCRHSERVATMFGLLHQQSGIPLRIRKNLFLCADCHLWMKNVSDKTGRKITLSDPNLMHQFHEGRCSCTE